MIPAFERLDALMRRTYPRQYMSTAAYSCALCSVKTDLDTPLCGTCIKELRGEDTTPTWNERRAEAQRAHRATAVGPGPARASRGRRQR